MTAAFDKAVATAPKLEKGVTNEEKLEVAQRLLCSYCCAHVI